jgi:hypothetical protein
LKWDGNRRKFIILWVDRFGEYGIILGDRTTGLSLSSPSSLRISALFFYARAQGNKALLKRLSTNKKEHSSLLCRAGALASQLFGVLYSFQGSVFVVDKLEDLLKSSYRKDTHG